MRTIVTLLMTSIALNAQVAQSQQVEPGDWPHFNRDKGSSRYSPLDQITADNVQHLQPAWTYKPGGTSAQDTSSNLYKAIAKEAAKLNIAMPNAQHSVGIKTVPVVVNGIMYVSAGDLVTALDGASGKEIWRHHIANGARASEYGVNYWPGTAEIAPRIFFTAKRNLIALDAATGELVSSFGNKGVIDMGIEWRGVPVVFGNVLAVGAFVIETPQDVKASGDTQGFDAITGAKKWVFHSVPRPGEVGHETWLNDGWKDRSGTNAWGPHMTVDQELGLLYFTLGSPSSNYYGGDRPGNNLFGNSIVAVDGNTGEYRWHFQMVHHDIWNYDNPPAPALVNIKRNGKTVPALAQIAKTGWMFILDRRTGEPIFGVEERPVPKGDVPGEWYSPTQPFPVKPVPLARMSFSEADLVTAKDTNEAHAANCKSLLDKNGGFFNLGPFTPFLLHKDGTPPRSTIIFPGGTGGTLWGGMATDQKRGHLFVYTQNSGSYGWTMEKKKGVRYDPYGEESKSNLPYTRGSINGFGPFSSFMASAGEGLGTYPCQKPPWGQLNAVDANTGELLWQKPVGVSEWLPEGKRNTGLPYGFAGPTATAGGVLFYAALTDGKLRAFKSQTGKELWSGDLGFAGMSQPISFTGSDGRQYVSITAGGTVQAFALPK